MCAAKAIKADSIIVQKSVPGKQRIRLRMDGTLNETTTTTKRKNNKIRQK